jgi:hypothetical protein
LAPDGTRLHARPARLAYEALTTGSMANSSPSVRSLHGHRICSRLSDRRAETGKDEHVENIAVIPIGDGLVALLLDCS